MTQSKFANGAFVFTRARKLVPRTPDEVLALARRHGFSEHQVPPYAGDRAAISRAISNNMAFAGKEGYLLRPVRRSSSEVVMAIVREQSDGVDTVIHEQSDLIRWSVESSSDVDGAHPIARRIAATYTELRGKLVGDDWTGTITHALEQLGAVAFREDGRVYWLPPQSLAAARKLQSFVAEIGLAMVVAEVEGESRAVVRDIVAESVEDQLNTLTREVQEFDGTQKPCTYTRRLEEYQRLRQRAILYRDSLGIGAEKAEAALQDLESRVQSMLDIRKTAVIPRGTRTLHQRAAVDVDSVGLRFCGARFAPAGVHKNEHLFTSREEAAVQAVESLRVMGVAGKWQNTGTVRVCLECNESDRSEASIRIQVQPPTTLSQSAPSLHHLGISLIEEPRIERSAS